LNAAMVRALHSKLHRDVPSGESAPGGAFRQGRRSQDAAADYARFVDDEGLFHLVADGAASVADRNLFSDRMLNDAELYRRCFDMQRMWASMPSQQVQDQAKRLKLALKLCAVMDAQMQKDEGLPERPLAGGSASRRSASSENVSRGSTPGGSAPGGSHQITRGSARGASATQSRTPSARGPDQTNQVSKKFDLIERIACNEATTEERESFLYRFKNNKAFQHQVLNRDNTYLSSKSPEGPRKAATLRIMAGLKGDAALVALFPFHRRLADGFPLAEESLGLAESIRCKLPEMLADEIKLLAVEKASESKEETPGRRRRPRASGQDRGSPASGGSQAGGQGLTGTGPAATSPGPNRRQSPARGEDLPAATGSGNAPRIVRPSQATTAGSKSSGRLDTSSERAAAASQGQRATRADTPSSFIVSESAMDRLHSKLREAHSAEPVRGRTSLPRHQMPKPAET
jgi:hypothetical protein